MRTMKDIRKVGELATFPSVSSLSLLVFWGSRRGEGAGGPPLPSPDHLPHSSPLYSFTTPSRPVAKVTGPSLLYGYERARYFIPNSLPAKTYTQLTRI